MRKRYKIVLNVEITDPEQPFPAGGDFMRLTRIEGVVHILVTALSWMRSEEVVISLDKVIDKGDVQEGTIGNE